MERFRVPKGRVELHPENEDYSPIVPEPGTVRLIGKVVEVRRKLE